MTDGLPTAGVSRSVASWRFPRRDARTFLFLLVLSLFGPRALSAHEVIDAEQVRAALAAVDATNARAKHAAGSATEGDAKLS